MLIKLLITGIIEALRLAIKQLNRHIAPKNCKNGAFWKIVEKNGKNFRKTIDFCVHIIYNDGVRNSEGGAL